jgi:hypothetical protein
MSDLRRGSIYVVIVLIIDILELWNIFLQLI